MYGLALEGGGTRGAAHAGVLRALHEQRILPGIVSGTSAGAMVAGVYAWRGQLSDVQEAMAQCVRMGSRLLDVNLLGIARGVAELATLRNFRLDGVFKGDRLQQWMRRFTDGAHVRDAAFPLVMTAVDLISGRMVYFSSQEPLRVVETPRAPGDACGPMGGAPVWEMGARIDQAVRASTAIPVAFRPYSYLGYQLVDGGVLEIVPVQALLAIKRVKVLAVVLETPGHCKPPDDVLGIGWRSIEVMQARLLDDQASAAGMVLRVRLPEGSGVFAFEQIEEYERLGYHAAMEAMPRIRQKFGLASGLDLKKQGNGMHDRFAREITNTP